MRHSSTPGRLAALATTAIPLTACQDDADRRGSAGEDSQPSSPSGDLVPATRLADVTTDTALTPGRYAIGFSSDQVDPPMVLIDVPAGYRAGGDGYEILAEDNDGTGYRHFDTWTVSEVACARRSRSTIAHGAFTREPNGVWMQIRQ